MDSVVQLSLQECWSEHSQVFDNFGRCSIKKSNHCCLRAFHFSFVFFILFVQYIFPIYSITFFLLLSRPYPILLRLRAQICDPPPLPVSCYVREYLSYLDAWGFTDRRASNHACRKSMAVTSCCAIPTLWCWSNAGCTTVDMTRLYGSMAVLRWIPLLITDLKRPNMKKIRRRLTIVLMAGHYLSLVRPTSSCVVRQGMFIPLSTPIIWADN